MLFNVDHSLYRYFTNKRSMSIFEILYLAIKLFWNFFITFLILFSPVLIPLAIMKFL